MCFFYVRGPVPCICVVGYMCYLIYFFGVGTDELILSLTKFAGRTL